MRVFLTGATGFIGTQVTRELLNAGHQIIGLTRSEAGARALLALGAEPYLANIEDLPALQRGAEACEAVIHTAFDHNFTHFMANCQKDGRVIAALGEVLIGSARPLIITSSIAMGASLPGQPADEDRFDPHHPHPRAASERAGDGLLQRGVNVMALRLAQIHNPVKQGLVSELIQHARNTGVSAYVGEGLNQWSAAPLSDTAHLYRLALEHPQPGARYHAIAQTSIAFGLIAQTIATGLGVPAVGLDDAEAALHFGWLSAFVGKDLFGHSDKTRTRLGWAPTGADLITDLQRHFNQ